MEVFMKTIAAAKFKEKCLSILENIDDEGLVITKHGKPLATLFPIRVQSEALIGKMKGKIKVKGDILSTGVKWDAQS
jgi:antitoxin (DNA-binding transcriptional repressor) of toxin-antitoxin stability system